MWTVTASKQSGSRPVVNCSGLRGTCGSVLCWNYNVTERHSTVFVPGAYNDALISVFYYRGLIEDILTVFGSRRY